MDLPKYADTWTELHNGISVDYNYPEGISFTGTSPEYYNSINTTPISENDYTIDMKIDFAYGWHALGCIFNYMDENNYCYASLAYDRDMQKGISVNIIKDGVGSGACIYYPLAGNTDYDFKVKVRNTNGLVFLYLNGVLELTENLPLSSSTIVYVDDNFNETIPGWGYDHFSSIQAGIDAVNVGGTVFVFSGIYYEHVIIDKSLDLIGENALTTIVAGDGSNENIRTQNYIQYVNISNIWSRTSAQTGFYPTMFVSHITFENCTASDCQFGLTSYASNNITIKNCNFYNNTGNAIVLGGTSNSIVSGCNIYNNYQGFLLYYMDRMNLMAIFFIIITSTTMIKILTIAVIISGITQLLMKAIITMIIQEETIIMTASVTHRTTSLVEVIKICIHLFNQMDGTYNQGTS